MEIIDYYLKLASINKDKIMVLMVTNVDGKTKLEDDYNKNSLTSEYLTELELEELNKGFKISGFNTKIYYEEMEFIKQISSRSKPLSNKPKIEIVLSMAQKGRKEGRKSLLPAFCDLYDLPYTSSNPYSVSLCRNKYHSGILLEKHEIKVPKSWLYTKNGWLFGNKPAENYKIIIKLNNESSSIGIDNDNIINYSEEKEYILKNMIKEYDQDLVIQEFIEGYEVEHPFIVGKQPISLCPIGIMISQQKFLGNKILTYNIRGTDKYSFYNYSLYNKKISEELIKTTEKIARILGITGFGRIDYRIDKNGFFYVTDIATNPHIVQHSSFNYSFQEIGYSYNNMLSTLIGITLKNNNYDSDQN